MEWPRSCRRAPRSALVIASVAVVLAAVACVAPNPVSQADPQADSSLDPTLPFPGELRKQIDRLNGGKSDSEKKKGYILETAYNNLPANFKTNATVAGLRHKGDYSYDLSKQISDPKFFPKYFADPFQNNPVKVDTDHGHYSYSPDNQVWVDFANHDLGGGVFGNGMVQEETMALSMPELANAAAIGYSTRTKGSEGPLNSSPEPLLFKNIQRTLELSENLYRDGWLSYSLKDLQASKTLLIPQHPNQSARVLAIAVEKLDGSKTQQTDIKTIEDLFNTFVAGYTLAKEDSPGAVINTGAIGTGDFKNDPQTVYVMQSLAWRQIGQLSVRYWASTSAYEEMLGRVIKNWQNDSNKSVANLMWIAHHCLTGAASCTK
jgi:Poly (ADP-ribose) glycohydrolase (PARG)